MEPSESDRRKLSDVAGMIPQTETAHLVTLCPTINTNSQVMC